MPCIGSTTIPISRRSSPHTCSTSSASWRPSTQIRLAAATFAGAVGPATEPDAVIAGADDRTTAGRRSVTGPPLQQEPARLPREVAPVLVAIAQRHGFDRPRHDVAAEPAGPILDDHARRHLDLGVGDRPLPIGEVVEDVALVGHRLHSSTGTGAARGASHRHGEHTRHHRDRPPTARRDHRHRHRRARRTRPRRVHRRRRRRRIQHQPVRRRGDRPTMAPSTTDRRPAPSPTRRAGPPPRRPAPSAGGSIGTIPMQVIGQDIAIDRPGDGAGRRRARPPSPMRRAP